MKTNIEYISQSFVAAGIIAKNIQKLIPPDSYFSEQSSLVKRYIYFQENIKEYNWIIPPSTKVGVLKEMIKEFENKNLTQKKVDSILIKSFKKKKFQTIDVILNNIKNNKIYSKRKKQLQNCLVAIKKFDKLEKTSVTILIPTLLVLIDALIFDFIKNKKIPFNGNYKSKSDKKNGRIDKFIEAITIPNDDMQNLLSEILDSLIFERTENLETNNTINRHTVIHGENFIFGNEADLFKLVAIIDAFKGLE
ncbi:hypothetical protein EHQ23_02340 [Leptospira bourretii]|uniref:RiboL-PSP-HEPN domain-containing protein n=1 Tax=Leptospira bourretii TaxID=2484962 RepID=A0A4R9IP11_9LEPT|nr:hypothetical protein [Leptospira bourretii]TGK89975.1 hypothetical protein EHQ23_02340 [Leptospira bourretii]TGK92198.1 hypothetical protein EHQ26_09485 [Leptospira bourretii]TGL36194.1 hypothetical protein EHQ45_07430 [Leptospira bourretii]